MSYAKQKRVDDCIGLLRYCQEEYLVTETSARVAAFRTLCDAAEFAPALQLFESLSKDRIEMKPWMVGRALVAATEVNRPQVVTGIFRQLVATNCNVQGGAVHDMVKEVRESAATLDEFALRSVAIFADRTGNAELALEVLDIMKVEGVDVTMDVYTSVLMACGKGKRWQEVVKVYDEMPGKQRERLYNEVLSFVIRAHTRSETEELIQRGLDIFKKRTTRKWRTYTCDAALEALLETRQFSELLALAEDMTQHNVAYSSLTYKVLTLAYIESGCDEKAKQLLLTHGAKMDDGGADCYRQLAAFYANVRGDPAMASQLYVDMIQIGIQLDRSDWLAALEFSSELPDQAVYWCLRSQLEHEGAYLQAKIPSRLLVPAPDKLHEQNISLPDESNPINCEPPHAIVDGELYLERLRGKWNSGDVELTEKEASALLDNFTQHSQVDECIQLLRYCSNQSWTLGHRSRRAAFRVLSDAYKFEPALQVFESLVKEKSKLAPWVFGRALDAATKLEQKDLVLDIFRRLVRDGHPNDSIKVKGCEYGVYSMVRGIRDQGVQLSTTALRSIAIFANRSDDLQLALEVLSLMQSQGLKVTMDVYGSVINAYGSREQWNDVMRLYSSMPEDMHSKLSSVSLSWVMTAGQKLEAGSGKLKPPTCAMSKEKKKNSLATEVSSVSLARKSLDDIRRHDGKGLTNNVASALLATMASNRRVFDCVDMLTYFETQRVQPKPFARLAAFVTFCETGELEHAVQVFETLLEEKHVLEPWAYGRAMFAVFKLNRHELFATMFRRMIGGNSNTINFTESENAQEMLHDVFEHGVNVPEFVLRSLASFAKHACDADLALHILSIMQNGGMDVSSEEFGAVFESCGKSKRWSDVIQVFHNMPESLCPQLKSSSLGWLIKAHTQSGEEELVLQILDLYENHGSKWSKFACNTALEALLQTRQFDDMLTLANDMAQHDIKWDSFTYTLVATAYIRNGSIDRATEFLRGNAKRMTNVSASCYRELIETYANTRGDYRKACQLSLEMMQNNCRVELSDWHGALTLALELPERDMYWRFRKLLWIRDSSSQYRIPSQLMIAKREDPQAQELPLQTKDESILQQAPLVSADVSLALEIFHDISSAGGMGLTSNVAAKLLTTMVNYKRFDDCMMMLEYFKHQQLLPKRFSRSFAFSELCDAKQYDKALQVFDTLLGETTTLNDWLYVKALTAGVQMKNAAVVSYIVKQMKECNVKLSAKEYGRITKSFRGDAQRGPTLEILETLRS
ncbi:unnamed protein product [Phytophthora lilii]|uniref:Unnamed protein product n=1 Tax=Phytophthora lilii TaxID=2077276 RepID=A0A9W6UEH7_9STRA|nr:unnamed protein product [Phytophthora lilii]